MQIGFHSEINNRMANNVDPDETGDSSGSAVFAKVSVLACRTEGIEARGYKKRTYMYKTSCWYFFYTKKKKKKKKKSTEIYTFDAFRMECD